MLKFDLDSSPPTAEQIDQERARLKTTIRKNKAAGFGSYAGAVAGILAGANGDGAGDRRDAPALPVHNHQTPGGCTQASPAAQAGVTVIRSQCDRGQSQTPQARGGI